MCVCIKIGSIKMWFGPVSYSPLHCRLFGLDKDDKICFLGNFAIYFKF